MLDHPTPPLVGSIPRSPVDAISARPTLRARLAARLMAGRLDRMVAVGVPAAPGSALAAHYARLASPGERQAVARALRRMVKDAVEPGPLMSSRIPLHVPNLTAAGELIDTIIVRLQSRGPVAARGLARLRVLLSDGSGPLFRYGRGDLNGRLGAALAEL